MAFKVDFVVSNLEEVRQNLPFWISLWSIKTRRELEKWGRDLVILASALSPSDKLRGIDSRRRPAAERLANKWRWEIKTSGYDAELDVGNIDDRMEFILFPTKGGASITPKGNYPLRFFDTSGNMFFKWSIKKGKTKGQPVHLWALKAFNPDSRIADLAQELVRRI